MIENENEITFSDPIPDGRIVYQDILFKNKIIGSLAYKKGSYLLPLVEWHQMIMPEEDVYKEQADNWMLSEDEGFIFVIFWTIEKFIEFYNKKESLK